MAIIKVKGLAEPLRVDIERAIKVKNMKFGNGNIPPQPPSSLVDLGEWAGELSSILHINLKGEIDHNKKRNVENEKKRIQENKQISNWLKQNHEQKSKDRRGWLRFQYCNIKNIMTAIPTESEFLEMESILNEWYAKNPNILFPPREVLYPVTGKPKNKTNKMHGLSLNGIVHTEIDKITKDDKLNTL